jgi:uncharacterized protein YPO0396
MTDNAQDAPPLDFQEQTVELDEPDTTAPSGVPSDALTSGFHLQELQIQNFGSYDGAPSVIRFGRGGAIFTGRNGVGKTTAIDAFRMLIMQEPSFNDATTPESRKRDRDIRTYYQGVIGKRQHEGRSEHTVLRPYAERKFMAIVGVFTDAGGRAISAARLVQYDPQGQGNSQRYIICRDRLEIARDFPRFDTGRAIRAALADKSVRIYETFNAYREALSGHFGIMDSRQAWALFERAIGTKTVDNLTEFMRDLILPASILAETADQLVRSTAALDEAYQTVKADEAKIARLQRIVVEIDQLEQSYFATEEFKRLQALQKLAAMAVVARSIRRDLKQRQIDLVSKRREHEAASLRSEELARRVGELELQERELGGQAVSAWRRDIEDHEKRIVAIKSDLAKLAASLSSFNLIDGVSFEESHHTEQQWIRIVAALRKASELVPGQTAGMDKTLAQLSSEMSKLESDIGNKQIDLQAAERAKSNLPRYLIEVREQLAEALGVSTMALPFFGELVRVSPAAAQDGWEGALNRLLGNQARRLLVPERLYAQAATWVDGRHLGIKLDYDRVDLVARREPEHGADRAAGKLQVREDSEFAGYVRNVLDTRYDHICFETADERFRRSRRALTKAGQSRDGDRHVKDDRRHIGDRAAHMLGWDTAERIAYLMRDLRRLGTDLKTAAESKTGLRSRRDGLMIQADQMRRLADGMGEFQSVDIARLENDIRERHLSIEAATSKRPDYVAITAALGKARVELREAKTAAGELGSALAVLDHVFKSQQVRLTGLEAELHHRTVPFSAWKGYRRLAGQVDATATIFNVDPQAMDVLSSGIWENIRNRIDEALTSEGKRRERTINSLARLSQDYLKEFLSETAHLAAERLTEEDAASVRQDWRQRQHSIESRELVRHRERLQQAMTDAIDNGIVNIRTQLEKERVEIRDTIAGINETLRAVTYDPAHGTKIRFVASDSVSQRISLFTRDLRQVTDDWIGNVDTSIEDRYVKTKRFIDQLKDVSENSAWRREVLDSRRWFTFVAQEYKVQGDGSEEIINDFDGASGSSGGQKERLAMTVMAAGLAWRFGMVDPAAAARSFRVLMLDEAFKNSHDDTTRALLDLFKAFGFQMIFAVPSKNLSVVANHIERAFAVDTKNHRTIITVHALKDLVHKNQSTAASDALRMAKEAGVDISDLDLSTIDEGLSGLTAETLMQSAGSEVANRDAAE